MPPARATRLLACLLPLAALFGPLATRAAEPETAQIHWQCWYDKAQHLACVLSQRGASAVASPAAALTADWRDRLPPVVVSLRERPDDWRGRIVRIPLHTEPLDDGFSAELAQSVLCGTTHRDCRVDYAPVARWSLQAAADFADRHDVLLDPRH